jgi:hypothetical protein
VNRISNTFLALSASVNGALLQPVALRDEYAINIFGRSLAYMASSYTEIVNGKVVLGPFTFVRTSRGVNFIDYRFYSIRDTRIKSVQISMPKTGKVLLERRIEGDGSSLILSERQDGVEYFSSITLSKEESDLFASDAELANQAPHGREYLVNIEFLEETSGQIKGVAGIMVIGNIKLK